MPLPPRRHLPPRQDLTCPTVLLTPHQNERHFSVKISPVAPTPHIMRTSKIAGQAAFATGSRIATHSTWCVIGSASPEVTSREPGGQTQYDRFREAARMCPERQTSHGRDGSALLDGCRRQSRTLPETRTSDVRNHRSMLTPGRRPPSTGFGVVVAEVVVVESCFRVEVLTGEAQRCVRRACRCPDSCAPQSATGVPRDVASFVDELAAGSGSGTRPTHCPRRRTRGSD